MASGEGGVNNGDLRSPSPLTRPSPVSYHIIFQGGIDPPENPLVAAYRELEEETVRTVYRVGALGALGRGGVAHSLGCRCCCRGFGASSCGWSRCVFCVG